MDPIAMLSEALNSSAVKETKLDIKPEVEEVKETPKPPAKPEKKVEKKEEDNWDDFVIPVIRKNGDN